MRLTAVRVFILIAAIAGLTPPAFAGRTIVFISDVHLGLGDRNPKEDFRTPEVLPEFLNALSADYGNTTDLVILGDLLELWQPPDGIDCGKVPEIGCSIADMVTIADAVASAHKDDLAALGAFAQRGENAVHVVPGNHDSALLIPDVWEVVRPRFRAPDDRVKRVDSGVWVSGDRRVAGEHGHQIAPDANRYANWPTVTKDGRMIRPWGEHFVQRIFNREEDQYPLVDNVTGSGGAKIRLSESTIREKAGDIARFIAFVLFDSSPAQQLSLLAPPEESPRSDEPAPWNLGYARARKHELLLLALPADDPMRDMLTPATRAELDAVVAAMSDEEISSVCASLPEAVDQTHPCVEKKLGHVLRSIHVIPRSYAIRRHLSARKKELRMRSLEVFVYGHTHVLEQPWDLWVDGHVLKVANSGAFHRLVDERTFRAAAKEHKMTPACALRELPFDVLPPCHTAVVVREKKGLYGAEIRQWNGKKLDNPCLGACARVSGCPKPKRN